MGTPPDLLAKVLFVALILFPAVSGTPILGLQDGFNQLVRRGIVSPSNDELMDNTLAFGIFAIVAFVLRM